MDSVNRDKLFLTIRLVDNARLIIITLFTIIDQVLFFVHPAWAFSIFAPWLVMALNVTRDMTWMFSLVGTWFKTFLNDKEKGKGYHDSYYMAGIIGCLISIVAITAVAEFYSLLTGLEFFIIYLLFEIGTVIAANHQLQKDLNSLESRISRTSREDPVRALLKSEYRIKKRISNSQHTFIAFDTIIMISVALNIAVYFIKGALPLVPPLAMWLTMLSLGLLLMSSLICMGHTFNSYRLETRLKAIQAAQQNPEQTVHRSLSDLSRHSTGLPLRHVSIRTYVQHYAPFGLGLFPPRVHHPHVSTRPHPHLTRHSLSPTI